MQAGPAEPAGQPATPAPQAPPAGSALPFGKSPLRTFALIIALPALVIYVATASLVIGGLAMMASEINSNDNQRTTEMVHAALDSFVASLGEAVADEGTWDEAYLNAVVALDAAWLDGTWGSTARLGQSYDNVFVTDSAGTIMFAENGIGPLTGNIITHFPAATTMLAELATAIEIEGDAATVAYFAQDKQGIAALAAISIHRAAAGEITVPHGVRRVLWIARHLTPAVMQGFAQTFRIPMPVIASQPAPEQSFAPIGDANGRLLGSVVWVPERPGDAAFLHALLIASLLLFAIGVVLAFGLSILRRALLRRAGSVGEVLDAARKDPATGHLNHFGLLDALNDLLRDTPAPKEVSVAYLGVDSYAEVQKTHGPEIAEELMRLIGEIIAREIGSNALLGRIAQDSFAIGATGARSEATVKQLAGRISEETGAPISVGELDLDARLSIGISTGPGMPGPQSLKSAEAAMREARKSGERQTVTYVMADEGGRRERVETAKHLRTAIKENQFELEYQPIFDLRAETLVGVEALLRWRRPDGSLAPADFIATAEAAGMMDEIGILSLRRAAKEIQPLSDLALGFNVGSGQFANPAFPEQLEAILRGANFPLQRLQLELDQSLLAGQPHRSQAVIEELRNAGIKVALDDFTVGQSSIGYLRQFKLDRVKLARSLVSGLDTDATKLALVETTVRVARDAGLAITALGVERKEEAGKLLRLGCTEFQGFLFARPMSLEALSRLLESRGELKEAS